MKTDQFVHFSLRRLLTCFSHLAIPVALIAQSQDALRSQLKGHDFYVAGGDASQDLEFASDGSPMRPFLHASLPPLFAILTGIHVKDVKLNADSLVLVGNPVWFEYKNNGTQSAAIKSDKRDTTIRIARATSGPDLLADAIPAVLNEIAIGPVDPRFIASMPLYWQEFFRHPPIAEQDAKSQPNHSGPDEQGFYSIGSGFAQPPVVAKSIDPQYSQAAKKHKWTGYSTVRLAIDGKGIPHDIVILRPTGLGLDEEAVLAISEYRFDPATFQGKPVPVQINIQVHYRIQ